MHSYSDEAVSKVGYTENAVLISKIMHIWIHVVL